ncbi:MAG: hypothetical protein EZS28_018351 [Streblomastix strix]|uniref:Uncharacterized protein n=1 Tax=Streblomastix strix TaxID=222440 RepID=A0A5J4VTX3_9EUKA|nr:MAG: hypothetical protein EZS28_018351 [Streblomastix strix]
MSLESSINLKLHPSYLHAKLGSPRDILLAFYNSNFQDFEYIQSSKQQLAAQLGLGALITYAFSFTPSHPGSLIFYPSIGNAAQTVWGWDGPWGFGKDEMLNNQWWNKGNIRFMYNQANQGLVLGESVSKQSSLTTLLNITSSSPDNKAIQQHRSMSPLKFKSPQGQTFTFLSPGTPRLLSPNVPNSQFLTPPHQQNGSRGQNIGSSQKSIAPIRIRMTQNIIALLGDGLLGGYYAPAITHGADALTGKQSKDYIESNFTQFFQIALQSIYLHHPSPPSDIQSTFRALAGMARGVITYTHVADTFSSQTQFSTATSNRFYTEIVDGIKTEETNRERLNLSSLPLPAKDALLHWTATGLSHTAVRRVLVLNTGEQFKRDSNGAVDLSTHLLIHSASHPDNIALMPFWQQPWL